MTPKAYVRLKARIGADARIVTVWAIDLGVSAQGMRRFSVVTKDGERQDRLIIGRDGSDDFISIRPARMNLHYAELELVNPQPER